MTIPAHALLAYAVYKPIPRLNWKKAVWWAIFPDFVWAIPLAIYLILTKSAVPTDYSNGPLWMYHLYASTHSFIISFSIIGVVYILKRKFPFEMLAWPLMHILMDLPGHTHFQTPFLYPLSHYSIRGLFSWTDPVFAVASYVVPIVILAVTYIVKREIRSRTQTPFRSV
ncbi:MAG: hypothetical protein NUV65_02580 [Candidatus Roizmanbacteria bacterium]|nr:hypothetical protein [Candidatus Roizmanbacteria bacterium]